jgi:hypothetical protein
MGDKKIIFGLGAALGFALLVIAFLLGRQSAPPPPTITVNTPPTQVQMIEAPPPIAPPPARPPAPPPDVVLEEKDGTINLVSPPKTPADRPAGASGGDGPIASYLAAIEQIRVGPGGDQQSFANQLMAEAATGNTQGIDQLVKEAKAAEARLAAISPPPEAATHHAALLALTREGNATLMTLSDALRRQDPNQLSGLLGTAKAMQTKAQEVQRLEDELRSQTK